MRANKFCRVDEETDLIAIKMYQQGKSLTVIAKELGLDRPTLSVRLQKKGLKLRPNRKYSVDEDYFDVIDTEHKAYWLGFAMADGTVSSRGVFEFTLKSEDSYMLEIFKDDIGSNAPIIEKEVSLNGYCYPASRLAISSRKFTDNLIKHGCIQNKTKVVSMENIDVPQELIRHFIRGYFDGNGCIGIPTGINRKPSSVVISIGSGSKKMMENLWDTILNECDVIFTSVSKSNTYFEMRVFSIDDKLKFLGYIYDSATIFLGKKRIKYMQFAAMRRRPSKFS